MQRRRELDVSFVLDVDFCRSIQHEEGLIQHEEGLNRPHPGQVCQ